MFGLKIEAVRIDPVRGLERYLAKRAKARSFVLFGSILSIIAAAVLFVRQNIISSAWRLAVIPAPVVLGVVGLILFSVTLRAYQTADWLELRDARQYRERLQDKIVREQQADVFGIVQLGLSQISEYYTINKSQARKSFNFAVFAIAIGLATVIGGVALVYSGRLGNGIGTVSAISGLLIQFFGGANFYIYNKSLLQMNYFYDRLMQMQDAMLAIKVGNQIENAELRDKVKEHIVAELLIKPQPHATSPQAAKTTKKKASAGKASAPGVSKSSE